MTEEPNLRKALWELKQISPRISREGMYYKYRKKEIERKYNVEI